MSKGRKKGTDLAATRAYADGFSTALSGKTMWYFPYTFEQQMKGSDIIKEQIAAWLLGFREGQKQRFEAILQSIEQIPREIKCTQKI